MNLSVSNIAWDPSEDHLVAAELQRLGVRFVELAPTKVFSDPTEVTTAQAEACVQFWSDHGISIGSFQSMLFGRPDLHVFGDRIIRSATRERLVRFLELASRLGAEHLVFGSPRNRQVPDGMSREEAQDIAVEFFSDLAAGAEDTGTVLCLEPNPERYDCNFVTTAAQGAELVRRVGRPGFRLHLDAAAMYLAGDDPHQAITESQDVLAHFHASAPELGQLEDELVDHDASGRALRGIGYSGHVAIEMRDSAEEPAVDRVAAAIALVRRHYELS